MKEILEQLHHFKTLSKTDAKQVLLAIGNGNYNHSEIASFLTAYIMRQITTEELKGFREALLELSTPINLSMFNPMDLCGTGGDNKNTFNISTLASLVVAGAGIPVAKHGNYGVSSVSGSSNVLERMGVVFKTGESCLKRQLEKANICFLHAPLFHPAMRFVAPVRQQLGIKTFFNMLGPLVNPSKPKIQYCGVFDLELARLYHYILQEEGIVYTIVNGLDGYDEISLTSGTKIISRDDEVVVYPEDFGYQKVKQNQIFGGNTVRESARIFKRILDGKGTNSQNNVVVVNAAMAIKTYMNNTDMETALDMAKASLFELKAKQSLTKILELQ